MAGKKTINFEELFGSRVFHKKIIEREFPQHIAITTTSFKSWMVQKELDIKKASEKHLGLLKELVSWQIVNDLPILTIGLKQTNDEYKVFLEKFLQDIMLDYVPDNKVRVFIVGKWYDLDQKLVELIKDVMNKTKDYDAYFLNICVNYDGQDEILSALQLLARKMEAQKLALDDINKETIKDNLFTSYFLPPQVMVETGHTFSGLLLWDCQGAVMHFTRKHWLDFDMKELETALHKYQLVKSSEEKVKEEVKTV